MRPHLVRSIGLALVLAMPAGVWAKPGGISGYSKQGCSGCHSGSNSGAQPSISVSGPQTVQPGATNTYTVTLMGGPALRAGLDVSTSAGTLATVSSGTKILNSEVVQSTPTTMSGGSISYQFKLTAPSTAQTVTLAAAGLSCGDPSDASGDKERLTTYAVTVSSGGTGPTVATPASANPNPVTSGRTTQLSVLGADSGGESNLTYSWSKTSGPGTVTFSASGSNAAKSTTATFSADGTYTLLVTLSNASHQTVTSSVTVTVGSSGGAVVVSPPGPVGVAVYGSQQFTVTVGGAAPTGTVTWALSYGCTGCGLSQNGLFTAGHLAGGPYTLTATVGGASGTSTVVVGTGDPPTLATPAAADQNPVTGTTVNLSVLGADAGGESALRYTWSATGPAPVTFASNGDNAAKATVATFSAPGSYALSAEVSNGAGLTALSTVSVTVQAVPAGLSVSPPQAQVVVLKTLQLTPAVVDQFGNALATPSVAWSVSGDGVVDTHGLFTAGSLSGTAATVTARSGGMSGSSQLAIVAQGEDVDPPTVSVSVKGNPSTVSGIISLRATASDTSGVTGVTFRMDGVPVGTVDTAGYELDYDTRELANGSHTLDAFATDAAGNKGASAPLELHVSNDTKAMNGCGLAPARAPAAGGGLASLLLLSLTLRRRARR